MTRKRGYQRFIEHDTGYQLQDGARCLRLGGHTLDGVNVRPDLIPPVAGTCVFCGSTVSPQQAQKIRKEKSNA